MPQINLRPLEFARQREFYLPRLIFVVGVIIYIFMVGSAGVFLHLEISSKEINLTSAKEEHKTAMSEKEKAVEDLQLIGELREKKRDLDKLLAIENNWHPYLDVIYRTAGGSVSIESFSGTDSGSFSFEAETQSLRRVADFLFTLQQTGEFARIQYSYIGKRDETLFNFRFEGQIDMPVEEQDDAGEEQDDAGENQAN